MGTVFTIEIRTPGNWQRAVADVVGLLHHVDAVFSTYRTTSDVSRLARGELRLEDAAADVARVLELCAQVQGETGGYFTALMHGRIDPTGLVKGWAVERASQLLREYGAADHAVNGGGDIQLAGHATPGQPWRVGIVDPGNRTRVLTVVTSTDLAVATSGTAERGKHILDPFTGRPAESHLRSATVVGPSLTRADAYATAAFVMGTDALHWCDNRPGYAALLVTDTGDVCASAGWHAYAEPAP